MTPSVIHDDGSIEDGNGNVLFFSIERFVKDICEGNCCFLCGAHPEDKEFNNEHIIPKWLLRKCDLYHSSITLINGALVRYDKYTIPCCKDCNSILGDTIEMEISEAVRGGVESVYKHIEENGSNKIFLWLSLIFFKTHLKDKYLRKNIDQRLKSGVIADFYDWESMHHIHCMIRTLLTDTHVDVPCYGSTYCLETKYLDHYNIFDYRDVYSSDSILIRIDNISFLAVLNDSCAAQTLFYDDFKKINGPLSPIQLREILAHLSLLNQKLKTRPKYKTTFDQKTGKLRICADLPKMFEIERIKNEEFGESLYSFTYDMLDEIQNYESACTPENIKSGRYNFLFDNDGKFIEKSQELFQK